MRLKCINIDPCRRKAWFVIFMGILFQCCTTRKAADYEAIRAAIPADVQLDETKHIALIFYNPEGCPPCNTIVGNLQQYTAYRNSMGNNSFIVFPSIRVAELQDYDDMLREYGNVNIRYINDKKLYKLLEQKDKEKFGGRPKWIGLNTTTKACYCFNLKDIYLADSIFARFSL